MMQNQTSLMYCFILSLCVLLAPNAYAADHEGAVTEILTEVQQDFAIPAVQVTILDRRTGVKTHYNRGNKSTQPGAHTIRSRDLMQIASVTKMFLATVLLQLEEESRSGALGVAFSLDDKLAKFFPEYPAWADISVRQLLNMTGGAFNYTEGEDFLKSFMRAPQTYYAPSELTDIAYHHEPSTTFPAGQSWAYSNTHYQLAGRIIEMLTGEALQSVLKKRIYKPLKLTDTYFIASMLSKKQYERMIHGYTDNGDDAFANIDVTHYNHSWASAAGGMVSTTADMVKWFSALNHGKVLSVAQLNQMHTFVCIHPDQGCSPGQVVDRILGYGLGVMGVKDEDFGQVYFHSGFSLGYTYVVMEIEHPNIVIAVGLNRATERLIAQQVATRILQTLYGKPHAKRHSSQLMQASKLIKTISH